MGNPVVHFEITGQDLDRLSRFYSELFGLKIDANNPMNDGLVDTGAGRGINGGIGQAEQEGQRMVTFYVEVDDPQAALDKAEALGGETIVPGAEMPNVVTFALFVDPEGHAIGLVKSGGETASSA